MPKQIAAFIDIPSQFRAVNKVSKDARIDYAKLYSFLINDDDLHKAYAYGVQLENESDQFIRALSYIGYIPVYKQAKTISLLCPDCKKPIQDKSIKETSFLVEMFVDIVRNIPHVSKIILGTSDPNVIPIIHWIKEQGVQVEILSRNIPISIKAIADKITEIPNELLEIKE